MTTITRTKPETIVASHNGFILSIVITLIIGLAAGAFVLSFDALHALALASAISPAIAWIWPLIIDGFIITATIAVFSLRGREARTTWYPWAALILFAFISVFGNSIHAVNNQDILGVDVWIASSVSAAPAIALLMASHFLVIMISAPKRAVETETIITDDSGHETGRVHVPQPFVEPMIRHVQPDDIPEDELKKELTPEKEKNTGQGSNEKLPQEPETLSSSEEQSTPENTPETKPAVDVEEPQVVASLVEETPEVHIENFPDEIAEETIPPVQEKENVPEPDETIVSEVVEESAAVETDDPNIFIVQEKKEPQETTVPEVVEEKPTLTQTLLMRFILDNPDFTDDDILSNFEVKQDELPKRVAALRKKYGETFENHPSKLKS